MPEHPEFAPRRRPGRRGFTLVELLVVIAIIAILLGLGVAAVGRFRAAAWKADTQSELMAVSAAIRQYHATFRAYPGPLPNPALGTGAPPFGLQVPTGYDSTAVARVTGTENLVLGLYGGLTLSAANTVVYDPTLVGQGPRSLNPGAPKKYQAFLDDAKLLSWQTVASGKTGHFSDGSADANDSIIPELVDRFPEAMPILFLRATVGYQRANPQAASSPTDNGVVTFGAPLLGQYQLEQVIGYTGAYTGSWPSMSINGSPQSSAANSIGEGKKLERGKRFVVNGASVTPPAPYHGLRTVNTAATLSSTGGTNFQYPYDAYPYLKHPTIIDTPRQKDEFILISAGPDRIYGTDDDITTFGSVGAD